MNGPNLDQGELFIRFATRVLIYGLKQVPGVGMALELAEEWGGAVADLRQKQEESNQEERLARIEAAMCLTPAHARGNAAEEIADQRRQGRVIDAEREAAVLDLASVLPATIRERTRATLLQARRRGTAPTAVIPVGEGFSAEEREAYYASLFPARRPRFRADDPLPNHNPEWQFQELIGAGGFGEVWSARHGTLGERWAVKFCQDERGARVLQREAETLYKLRRDLPRHPNIVALTDLQLRREPFWLAFEYVEGGDLEGLMRIGPMGWNEALALFRPIVAAMAEVHRLGIVHRDLKPANILLDKAGQPKITDFGIGKVIAEQESAERRTRTHFTTQGFGSAGYMSPEQEEGQAAHPSDDTYALGVILWQMLAGTLKPIRYPRQIEQLVVPESAKELLTDCLFMPRDARPRDGMAMAQRMAEVAERSRILIPQDIHGWPRDRVQLLQSQVAQTLGLPVAFRDKLQDGTQGPEMVLIPPGCFRMGSPNDEPERLAGRELQHTVTISQSFAIGRFAVTVGEFGAFAAATGYRTEAERGGGAYAFDGREWKLNKALSWRTPGFAQEETHPVVCVSWNDAVAYLEWLCRQTGQPYRLPTEAEWEYACRAGTGTPFWCGNTLATAQANYHGHYPYNGGAEGEYRGKTLPVQSFEPNPWGLYQVHGNVWEWCEDWFGTYPAEPVTDPEGPLEGAHRVLRGGSWVNFAGNCRSTYRNGYTPGNRDNHFGFRLARGRTSPAGR